MPENCCCFPRLLCWRYKRRTWRLLPSNTHTSCGPSVTWGPLSLHSRFSHIKNIPDDKPLFPLHWYKVLLKRWIYICNKISQTWPLGVLYCLCVIYLPTGTQNANIFEICTKRYPPAIDFQFSNVATRGYCSLIIYWSSVNSIRWGIGLHLCISEQEALSVYVPFTSYNLSSSLHQPGSQDAALKTSETSQQQQVRPSTQLPLQHIHFSLLNWL